MVIVVIITIIHAYICLTETIQTQQPANTHDNNNNIRTNNNINTSNRTCTHMHAITTITQQPETHTIVRRIVHAYICTTATIIAQQPHDIHNNTRINNTGYDNEKTNITCIRIYDRNNNNTTTSKQTQ